MRSAPAAPQERLSLTHQLHDHRSDYTTSLRGHMLNITTLKCICLLLSSLLWTVLPANTAQKQQKSMESLHYVWISHELHTHRRGLTHSHTLNVKHVFLYWVSEWLIGSPLTWNTTDAIVNPTKKMDLHAYMNMFYLLTHTLVIHWAPLTALSNTHRH